jgi:colicin import membrane protein
MAEKRENSVLFSLRELKNIEEDRVKEEHDDRRRREDELRAAKEAEERAAREAAERARRDAEDAERRRYDEIERQKREEQLRLDESERKARVEAQMKLEEQRLKMEIDAQAMHGAKKSPKALIAISGILVLVVAVGGYFAYNTIQENQKKTELARAQALQAQQDNEALKKELDRLAAEGEALDKEYATTLEAYKNADEAQKKALDEKLKRLQAEKQANTEAKKNVRQGKAGGAGKTAPAGPALKLCPPGQPIC